MEKHPTSSKGLVRSGAQQLFISSVIAMSWQLAISFLTPVIIGVEIDSHNKTSPWFTLAGLGLAILLGSLVVWRSVASLNRVAAQQAGRERRL